MCSPIRPFTSNPRADPEKSNQPNRFPPAWFIPELSSTTDHRTLGFHQAFRNLFVLLMLFPCLFALAEAGGKTASYAPSQLSKSQSSTAPSRIILGKAPIQLQAHPGWQLQVEVVKASGLSPLTPGEPCASPQSRPLVKQLVGRMLQLRVSVVREQNEKQATAANSADSFQPSFNLVAIDARMPAHRHGMVVRPNISSEDPKLRAEESMSPQAWQIDGFKLHMDGHWSVRLSLDTPEGRQDVGFELNL